MSKSFKSKQRGFDDDFEYDSWGNNSKNQRERQRQMERQNKFRSIEQQLDDFDE